MKTCYFCGHVVAEGNPEVTIQIRCLPPNNTQYSVSHVTEIAHRGCLESRRVGAEPMLTYKQREMLRRMTNSTRGLTGL